MGSTSSRKILLEFVQTGRVSIRLGPSVNKNKLCKQHVKAFRKSLKSKGKKGKTYKPEVIKLFAYLKSNGYPASFYHNTPYINCERCREITSSRSSKYRMSNQKQFKRVEQKSHFDLAVKEGTITQTALSKPYGRMRLMHAKRYAGSKRALKSISDKLEVLRAHLEYLSSSEGRFYSSAEWVALRALVINIYGKECMCCGRGSLCGNELHVDHIVPRSVKPELALDIKNLQILCLSCNSSKSNKRDTDYRPVNWKNVIEAKSRNL